MADDSKKRDERDAQLKAAAGDLRPLLCIDSCPKAGPCVLPTPWPPVPASS